MTQKQIDALASLDAFNKEFQLKPAEYFNYFKDVNTRTLSDSGKRDEIIKSSYSLYTEQDYSTEFIKDGLRKLSFITPSELTALLAHPSQPFTLDDICIVWQDDEQIAYFFLPSDDYDCDDYYDCWADDYEDYDEDAYEDAEDSKFKQGYYTKG